MLMEFTWDSLQKCFFEMMVFVANEVENTVEKGESFCNVQ